jgi:hypothetical protein
MSNDEWLKYYEQCVHFIGAIGEKLTGMMTHTLVIGGTVMGGMFILKRDILIKPTEVNFLHVGLIVLAFGGFGLEAIYSRMIYKYFGQVKETGRVMQEIELHHLTEIPENSRLMHAVRQPHCRFYGSILNRWLVAAIPLAIAFFFFAFITVLW